MCGRLFSHVLSDGVLSCHCQVVWQGNIEFSYIILSLPGKLALLYMCMRCY